MSSAFWEDLQENLKDPKFKKAFEKARKKIAKYDAKANNKLARKKKDQQEPGDNLSGS